MNCEEVRDQLPDYALGTLSEVETAAVRRHLRGCAGCRTEAAGLDEGVGMFASAAHDVEPPPDLQPRVMGVLAEEWAEAAPRPRRAEALRRHAAAAAVAALLAGALAWGGVAQSNATRFHADATSYRQFLQALGGRDVRTATLRSTSSTVIDGSVVLYDSNEGQSWALVFARVAGGGDQLTAVLVSRTGQRITIPFPIKLDPDGDGWTIMVTANDIRAFNRIQLTRADGSVVASGTVIDK